MKSRSIITEHLVVSVVLLAVLLTFLSIGHQLIEHIRDDGQLINLAGSLRYRTYKLLLLQREYVGEQNPALKSVSYSLLQNEIEDFDKTCTQIRQLTRTNSLFKGRSRLDGFSLIDKRWRDEMKPLLLSIMDEPGITHMHAGRYTQLSGDIVVMLNYYVSQLGVENKTIIERFTWMRIVFVSLFVSSFLLIAYFTNTKLIRPLAMLRHATEQLRHGNFSAQLPQTATIKEVDLLYRDFNEVAGALQGMMRDLEERSETLMAFNRASNELAQLVTLEQIYDFIANRASEILHADLAWVGLIEKGHQDIIPVAVAGRCSDLMKEVRITWDDTELGQGPSGRAIRGARTVKACVDEPELAPWRDKFNGLGLSRLISIPLLVREECIGVLTLVSASEELHRDHIVDICQVYANHAAAVIEDLKLTEYIIFSLARAAEANDEDTGNHILRVGEYCALLAHEMGLSPAIAHVLRFQATLHDVGKIHVNPAILKKNGPLTDEEWREMKQHPRFGSKIIGDHPMLAMAREIALSHHERWDGGGYPFGLKGDEIPLTARIMNIADQYDALRSQRAYKPPFDHVKTCAIILEGDGRTKPEHFDPMVLAAFSRIHEQFERVYQRLK